MAGSTDYIVMLLTGDDTETYRSGCKNLPSGYDFLVENESPLKFGNPQKTRPSKDNNPSGDAGASWVGECYPTCRYRFE